MLRQNHDDSSSNRGRYISSHSQGTSTQRSGAHHELQPREEEESNNNESLSSANTSSSFDDNVPRNLLRRKDSARTLITKFRVRTLSEGTDAGDGENVVKDGEEDRGSGGRESEWHGEDRNDHINGMKEEEQPSSDAHEEEGEKSNIALLQHLQHLRRRLRG